MYKIINFYDQFNFNYVYEDCIIVAEDRKNMPFKLFFKNKNDNILTEKNKIILNNTNEKFLIPLNFNFAHCFLDVLSTVFFINYFKKNVEIIFYGNHEVQGHDITDWFNGTINKDSALNQVNNNLKNLAKICFDFIDQLKLFNIKYSYVNFQNNNLIANNIYMLENEENGCGFAFKTANSINIFNKYINELKNNNIFNKNNNNFNKIYLSRSKKNHKILTFDDKNLDSYASSTIIPRLNPVSNSRLLNENILEDFLEKTFGFKIIDENIFNSLSEQINFINSGSILMSQSGAALTNLIFMEENTLLVELFTPVNVRSSIEEYHDHWSVLSKRLYKNYISIPHNKNGIEVIDQIQNNKYLYNKLKN